ncbi:MAG: hypothetical protein H6773_01010 [Pseudomonadales bacterium]|nr:hypothetical protein [Pseudomonadales bacterium]
MKYSKQVSTVILWVAIGLLALVLISATLFKFWKLDVFPSGLNWDEVAYSYNAFSLLKTGKDEWGTSFPIFLRSFGDFKPALLSYLQVPFIALFGLNSFASRLPVAVMGALSTFFWWLMLRQLALFETSKYKTFLQLLSLVLFATAPWLVHYSRAAMDPIVSFFFLVAGIALFISKKNLFKYSGAVVLLLAMYTYNSARLFVPLLLFSYFMLFDLKTVWKNFSTSKALFGSYVLVALFTVVIFVASVFSGAGARAEAVFILNKPMIQNDTNESLFRSVVLNLPEVRLFANKMITGTYVLAKNYMVHFDPSFVWFDNTLSARHGFNRHGNLLLVTLPLIGVGIYFSKRKKVDTFFLLWLLLGVLPSTLSDDVPHSGRTLIQLPAYIYFATVGVEYLSKKLSSWKISQQLQLTEIALLGLTLTIVYNTSLYFVDLYRYFPEDSYLSWQGDAQTTLHQLTKDYTLSDYSHVYLSPELIENYLFYPFYTQMDPTRIQTQHAHTDVEVFDYGSVSVHKIDICMITTENALIVSDFDLLSLLPSSYSDAYSTNPELHLEDNTIMDTNRYHLNPPIGYIYTTNTIPDDIKNLVSQNCGTSKMETSAEIPN